MDNRIFNVNGSGAEMLQKAIELAFMQFKTCRESPCASWGFSKQKGLILNWSRSEGNPLPIDMDAEDCAKWAWKWLQSDEAKSVELSEFCGDYSHDGHNTEGWQVYIEDWGRVGSNGCVLCAIKPAYMWHGK